MPYQIDFLLRVPLEGQEDGYYYWTQAWIVNANSDSEAITRLNQVDSQAIPVTLHACQAVRAQMKRSPGMGGVYNTVNLFNDPGSLPDGTTGYSLLNYCRVNFYIGDEIVGYKRWRFPMRTSDMAGEVWSTTTVNLIQGACNNLIALGALAARSGAPVESALVDPLIRPWQLRTGTKRRNRPVIA